MHVFYSRIGRVKNEPIISMSKSELHQKLIVRLKTICCLVDTPDPQFIVTSSKTKRPHLKQFKTHNIKDNVTKGFIGETFNFVIPKDLTPEEKFPIEVNVSIFTFLFFPKANLKPILLTPMH